MDFVIATKVEFENNANIFVVEKLRFNDVNVKYKFNGNDGGKLYSKYFRGSQNSRFVERSFCSAKLNIV